MICRICGRGSSGQSAQAWERVRQRLCKICHARTRAADKAREDAEYVRQLIDGIGLMDASEDDDYGDMDPFDRLHLRDPIVRLF